MNAKNYEELLRQALQELRTLKQRVATAEGAAHEPLAIIGLGCRFPAGGDDPESFWEALERGEDGISDVPTARWSMSRHYDPDPSAAGKMYTRRGAFLEDIDGFDAEFFSIAPREAASLSPQQRLVLEVAWETLEYANILPASLFRQPVGVYIGACGYGDGTWSPGIPVAHEDLDAYRVTGGMLSAIAGRISYAFGFTGPSLVVDTACSSSLVALHLACQALRQRECDVALAGGVNVLLSPAVSIGLSRTGGLAADGKCKTFDASADGFTRGEGCGMVALKRLSDAARDGDHIIALVRGSAINQDGPTGGLTVPSGPAQQALISSALGNARLDPLAIDYIEAHGTGTPLGDPIEIQALAPLLDGRDRAQPLRIGSVKTNIGHLEGAAGIAGVIKTALALHHERIPANLHFNEPNPHIPWDELPLTVPTTTSAWPRGERPRFAGISGFGFSGTNAHIILGEAPPAEACAPPEPASREILVLAAATEPALRTLAGEYAALIGISSRTGFGEICASAALSRTQFPHRLSMTASTCEDAAQALGHFAAGQRGPTVTSGHLRPNSTVRTAFLFTGQGAQYPGMGLELYATYPRFRATLDRCAEILQPHLEQPLLSVLYPKNDAPTPLDDTAYTQPALFAVEYALADLFASWGIKPDLVLGHSVGEYVAACVAGVLSLEDGLRLIAERGRLMQALPRDGAMAAIAAAADTVRETLVGHETEVDIAAINGPGDVTIAGKATVVNEIIARLQARGIRCRILSVSHAFHSPLMEPMLPAFAATLGATRLHAPTTGFVSNLSAGLITGVPDADHWLRHVRAPVRFYDGMLAADAALAAADDEPVDIVYVEIGPKPALIGLARDYLATTDREGKRRRFWVPTLRAGHDAVEQALAAAGAVHVHGGAVDWTAIVSPAQGRRARLPSYPFQRQRFPLRADVDYELGAAAAAVRDSQLTTVWQPQAIASTDAGNKQRWLIASTDVNAASGLSGALAGLGVQAITAVPATADRQTLPHDLGFDFTSAADWDRTVQDLAGAANESAIDAIVYLVPASADGHDPATAFSAAVGGALELLAALARRRAAVPPVWLVSTGAQAVDETMRFEALAGAGLWGLARCVAAEAPALIGGIVDLDPAADLAASARSLRDEVAAAGTREQVAYRGTVRHVARLEPDPAAAANEHVAIRADASYLVTGGLGGLGLEIAQWLATRGARHLVLVGRRPPAPPAAAILSTLRDAGVEVHVVNADVGDGAAMDAEFARLRDTTPPLAGVIHAAGTIDDATLAEQSAAHLARVATTKVSGAWNLHRLTAAMPLDFFVMFSSAASILGSPGQANYGASNAFMDGLAVARRGAGLPAVSLNWGPWAEVGLAAAPGIAQHLEKRGLTGLPPERALEWLAQLLAPAAAQLVVIRADWPAYLAQIHPAPPLFARLGDDTAGPDPAATPDFVPWPQLFNEIHPDEHLRRLIREIRCGVAAAVGLAEEESIDPDLGFFDLGFDSLMAVELKSFIEVRAGMALPTSVVFDYPTINKLSAYVAQELGLGVARGDSAPAPAEPDALAELDGLSDDDVGALLDDELEALLDDGTLDRE